MSGYQFLDVCQCDKCSRTELAHESLALYVCAATHSIATAKPGFVSDTFLDSYTGDATIAAVDLCMEGRWIRREGGYEILHSPLVDAVVAVRDRLERNIVLCRQAGSHTPQSDDPECCTVCGIWMDDDLKRRL